MKVGLLDTSIIGAYFIAIVGLGLWISRRRAKGGREFFLAGNRMTWPFIGASLFATNISSQQFVGQAGLAFTVGLVAGGFQMIGAMCFMFLAVFFLRTYMGLRLTTSPEFFERRYSVRCRTLVSFINLMMVVLANLTAALYAGATVLTHLLGWDTNPHANVLFGAAVLLIGLAAGVYTLLGGLRAVIYCDFVQMIVLVLGGALLLLFGIARAGGISEVLAFRAADGTAMWTLIRPWHHDFGWLTMLTGTVVLGVHGHCTDQDYVQRALSASSLYHAKMGAVFGGFLKVLALFVIAAPGVVAAQLVSQGALTVPEGDSAYVAMLAGVMPVGLLGVCLAGLLAAIMSSVDSGLCACGSLLTYDFLAKIRRTADDRELLRDGRIIMAVVLAGCILIAPSIRYFEGLFHYLLYVWALLAPPVFVCVIFGLYCSRASARAAFVTLVVGCLLGLAALAILKFPFLGDFRHSLPLYLQNKLNIGFVNALVCAIVMFAVSYFGPYTDEDRAKAELIRQSGHVMPMTTPQRIKYWLFLGSFVLVWLGVLLVFCPLGIGR
ncbi:MAG: sodium:solute symporter family transporter [Planctomycetota bacterium]|jgi:SSS family solute:Na+ symporter